LQSQADIDGSWPPKAAVARRRMFVSAISGAGIIIGLAFTQWRNAL